MYLVGFMGAGKSTVARSLARRLDWKAEDIDERIEQRERRDIPTIFRQDGEPYFRGVERQELIALLPRARHRGRHRRWNVRRTGRPRADASRRRLCLAGRAVRDNPRPRARGRPAAARRPTASRWKDFIISGSWLTGNRISGSTRAVVPSKSSWTKSSSGSKVRPDAHPRHAATSTPTWRPSRRGACRGAGPIGYDEILVLGDLVGYGATIPTPSSTKSAPCARAPSFAAITTRSGSASRALKASTRSRGTRSGGRYDALTADNRNWLAALPAGPVIVGDLIEICHGTPFDEDAYVFDDLDALRALHASQRPLCLFGHTHVQIGYALAGDQFTLTTMDEKRPLVIPFALDSQAPGEPGLGRPAPRRRPPCRLRRRRHRSHGDRDLPHRVSNPEGAAPNPRGGPARGARAAPRARRWDGSDRRLST